MENSVIKNIVIIGLGRLGTALAFSLTRFGYKVRGVTKEPHPETRLVGELLIPVRSLGEAVPESDVIFITTPDGVIPQIAAQLAEYDLSWKAVFHLSGSHSSGMLSGLKEKGACIGSLHPLQSFASVEQALKNLPGSFFTYEGDQSPIGWVSKLVEEFGGILKILPSAESKVIYHAGAVIVSNYLVALAGMGVKCLQSSGFSAEEAQEALLPLMRGTLNNISRLPLGKALTGPVSRGDVAVVASHLEALAAELPDIKGPYSALVPVLADIALNAGKLSPEKYQELNELLD